MDKTQKAYIDGLIDGFALARGPAMREVFRTALVALPRPFADEPRRKYFQPSLVLDTRTSGPDPDATDH